MSRSLLRALLAVSFLLLAAALAWTPISNNDIWLHLKTGSLILDRWAVPRAEEYTFTREGAPIVDHEWLSQVIFALAWRAGGLGGLALLKTLLTAATLAIVFREAARAAPGQPTTEPGVLLTAAAIATAGAAFLIASHLFIRPHLFTFLLAAAFVSILPRLDSAAPSARWRAAAAIAGLQVLWANLHGGFVVGILLAAVHAAGAAFSRRSLVPALALPPALAAASLLNPYGPRIYALVGAFNDPAFHDLIIEWKSPFTEPFALTPLFWVYAVWLIAVLAAAAWALKRRDVAAALGALSFSFLSVMSRRHVSLLGVVTAPLLARAAATLLQRFRPRASAASAAGWATWLGVLALAAFVGFAGLPWDRGEWRRPGGGVGENIPVEALEVMRAEGVRGRVGGSLAFGAYVTWAGWPELKTFIDSRLEVFGGDFLTAYEADLKSTEAFTSMMRRTPFDIALLAWQHESVQGAMAALAADPEWALVYFDDVAALFVKRAPEREDLIRRRAFTAIDPVRYFGGAEPAGGIDEMLAEAEAEARRAAAAPPVMPGRPAMNAVARTILGSILQRQGRHAEAAVELRAAVAARPNDTVAWGLLGLSLLQSGDRSGAREAFTELKRRAPASVFADRMLEEIGSGGSGK